MFFRACSLVLVALFSKALLAQTAADASHSRIELITSRSDIRAREPLWIGVRITPKTGWHTYWKNPGDAGMAPSLSWSFPRGKWQAEELQWPAPERIQIKRLASYGYNGTLLLPQRLFAPAALPAGAVTLKLRVDWLVCEESCIAQDAELALPLTAATGTARADSNIAIGSIARSLLKTPSSGYLISANAVRENGMLKVSLSGLPSQNADKNASTAGELFFEKEGIVEPGPAPKLSKVGAVMQWQAPLTSAGKALKPPASLQAVWVPADGSRALLLSVSLR